MVVEWPTPSSHKQLQRFLGFANFYRRFIHNYSRVAAPLTHLTSLLKPFQWPEEVEVAFTKTMLKTMFSSASILFHPDPSHQFMVEVDTFNIGVDLVLSRCGPETPSLRLLQPAAVPCRGELRRGQLGFVVLFFLF